MATDTPEAPLAPIKPVTYTPTRQRRGFLGDGAVQRLTPKSAFLLQLEAEQAQAVATAVATVEFTKAAREAEIQEWLATIDKAPPPIAPTPAPTLRDNIRNITSRIKRDL